jgi:DNA polymerase-3 subunit gamma/tau
MSTLYRQYRPTSFAEVVGQEQITETLKAALVKNRISHAYLFQGPRGTGKTTTARIFAKRLNCTAAKGAEPCNACPSCLAMQGNQHMDMVEIDAASNRGIEDIKALRESASVQPSSGTYKVYIIDEVHMLSHDAFGALLKILEEPPAHVIFILATTELHKVPPTILSRCQLYRFRRATPAEMKQRLTYVLGKEGRSADDDLINFIIQRSDGCYRDAESLLGQILTVQGETTSAKQAVEMLGLPSAATIEQLLAALVAGNSSDAISVIDQAYETGLDPEQLLKESIRVARDGAVALAKGEKTVPAFAQAANAASRLPTIIRALLQALQDLAYVPQPIIALHLAILTVCTAPAAQTQFTAPKPTPAPIKAVIQPVTPVVAQEVAPAPSTDFSLADVQKIWGEVISALKTTSPVSSTFLRACEPIGLEGNRIVLRVQYSLHKNFFEKADNKTLVETHLSKLLKATATIRCQLEAPQPAPAPVAAMPATAPVPAMSQSVPATAGPSNDLYNAVKEVFG